MTDIVFMDTECLGLDPAAPVWEFAAIRRNGVNGSEVSTMFTIQHDPRGWLDGFPEPFLSDYRRRYTADAALPEADAARKVANFTDGAHIVGAVPNFDTERLERLLRRNGLHATWHYHLIDVENLATGYLAARGRLMAPPWKSDELSTAIGVDPTGFDRHTAMGDVLWVRAQWDAVMTPKCVCTAPLHAMDDGWDRDCPEHGAAAAEKEN